MSFIVTTEKMVYGGNCIAKTGGKTIFVPYSLPGEQLEITVVQDRRDYAFARIDNILNPSPHRIDPRCPFFGVCGGCNMQMAEDTYQIQLRMSMLEESFVRAGFAPPGGADGETARGQRPVLPRATTVCGDSTGYRSRFQLHGAKDSAGRAYAGLKGRSAQTVVPVNDCPVAVPLLRDAFRSAYFSPFAEQYFRKCGDSQIRFHVFASERVRAEDGSHIAVEQPENGTRGGTNKCTVSLSGRDISFDVRGFFQSNVPMLEKLAACIHSYPGGDRLADLYGGVGTFSVFLADKFGETELVEHNKNALIYAEQNLRGTRHTCYAQSTEKWAERRSAEVRFDTVVADPPRQGLGKPVRKRLTEMKPPRILYVSCDPVTLARDAAEFAGAGYVLETLVMFDFYPQTSHIETLACFGLPS